MDFNQLRQKHPVFVYENFKYKISGPELEIEFHFHAEPDLDFYPKTTVPLGEKALANLDVFVFNLGLIELISYWKAVCSPTIVIKAGHLTADQISWWKNIYLHGLGEFFYVNKIDITQKSLLSIESRSPKQYEISDDSDATGELVLIGGGKDSAVTADLLPSSTLLMINPTVAALSIAEIAGNQTKILVTREIDPLLLQLNEQGYLNGHTPFSAYLSFVGTLVAHLHGYKNVIVSNESSAGEANLSYQGLTVNHQYSKSFEYEKDFREYSSKYLSRHINYFSFVRPLGELQIAALFALSEKFDKAFNSCNVSRNAYWCGECAKCAFVYLVFSAIVDENRRKRIFGDKDYFENGKIKQYIKDLTGEGTHKPLDCVGSEEESKMALKLIENPKDRMLLQKIKNDWDTNHFLPESYEAILRNKMKQLQYE